MSKVESITRYNLIIKKLRDKPATFKEISASLEKESELQGYNFSVSKRTFQRDVDDILSLYGINIEFDFSRKVYHIDFDETPEISQRILEAFETINALNISDKLSKHIYFEKRKPQGTQYLYGVVSAIKNKQKIKFIYQKFINEKITIRLVEPYAVVESKTRWYLIAKDEKDNVIKSFAIDRLTNLENAKQKFQFPKDFDIHTIYKNCFGIINTITEEYDTIMGKINDVAHDVVLSFQSFQGKYIKSLPLHHSQQILIDSEKELRIKLKLNLTQDFIMEILSFGEKVKVIEPKILINQIKLAHQKAAKQY